MLRKYITFSLAVCAMMWLSACSEDNNSSDQPVPQPEEQHSNKPANIMTRSEESVISTSVDVGLYMQHYADGKMMDLRPQYNYLNNVKMSYSNGYWKAQTTLYWYDDTSLSDVYAYAPYQKEVTDCRNMPISIPVEQTTTERLAAADLLWGRNLALNPSTDDIAVLLNHRLARVNVTVKPEADFAEGELKAEDLKLYINNVKCEATMDLQTSDITLSGEPLSICAHNNGDLSFTAIVIPQSVGFVNLIRVEWKDVVYTLQHSTTFEAQRSYNFSVSINKQEASGLNIGISGWDIDGKDYGGVVE